MPEQDGRGVEVEARMRLGDTGQAEGEDWRGGGGGDSGHHGGGRADQPDPGQTDGPEFASGHAQGAQLPVAARFEGALPGQNLGHDQDPGQGQEQGQHPQGHGLQMDGTLRVGSLGGERELLGRLSCRHPVYLRLHGREIGGAMGQAQQRGGTRRQFGAVRPDEGRSRRHGMHGGTRLWRKLAGGGVYSDYPEADGDRRRS